MSWIRTIDYQEADPGLKKIYHRVQGPNNNIDNVLMIHSLRPHTLVGHMTLYKNVLHNSNNTCPKWYLELIGVYVSHLNQCDYCVQHHFEGLRRLLNNNSYSEELLKAVKNQDLGSQLESRYFIGIQYSQKLTLEIENIKEEDVESLRSSGFTDGEILEINQAVSYFNYVNRTVIGLGVNTKGDIIGLSPNNSDDSTNWGHS